MENKYIVSNLYEEHEGKIYLTKFGTLFVSFQVVSNVMRTLEQLKRLREEDHGTNNKRIN